MRSTQPMREAWECLIVGVGLAPLTGAVFVVLAIAAVVGSGEETRRRAPARALRSYLRRADGCKGLAAMVLAGGFIFGICSGLAILRGADLPNWLGWIAVLLGIAAIVPPASFIALGVLVLWSLAVTILMYRRSSEPTPASATPAVHAKTTRVGLGENDIFERIEQVIGAELGEITRTRLRHELFRGSDHASDGRVLTKVLA